MKKVNINEKVRVKLTPKGSEIYYHQHDDLRKFFEEKGIDTEILAPRMPQIDKDGFTSFQLWHLINLYGEYMDLASENVFSDISLYFDDDVLEDVKTE